MEKDCRTVWSNCLVIIRQQLNEQSYSTWFEPIVPVRLHDNVLTIQIPSQFFYEWLEEHYVHLLRTAINAELGPVGKLEYAIIVDKGNDKNRPLVINVPTGKAPQNRPRPDGVPSEMIRSPFEMKDLDSLQLDSYLKPHYSFDNFVEGECNRLARAAGVAVAEKPGLTSFNPLLIQGGVGLGKTHLVQAIGNFVKNHTDTKFVLYVTSEKFTNQFIDAIRNNTLQNFTNFYLQVDVLIIDDIQFFSGKERTQEIFFHIFNHLHQSGKQIVLTTDRLVKDLKGVEERLTSRFRWGLTADLQLPDLETRIAIIQKKLQADGIDIPYNVIEYVAHSIDTNIRELEGVVVSLMAQASLTRKDIDLELTKKALQNFVISAEKNVNVESIQQAVVSHFDMSLDDLKGKSRTKDVVVPRQIAMYLTKEHTDLALKSIGYHFGGRDHSTVIHSIQAIHDMLVSDRMVKNAVEEIRKTLKVRKNGKA